MRFYRNVVSSLRTAMGRFPAVFLLALCTAVLLSAWMTVDEFVKVKDAAERLGFVLGPLILATVWCMVFAFVAQLLAELLADALFLRHGRRAALCAAFQMGSLALVVPLYFFCRLDSQRVYLIHHLSLSALMALCPWLLHFTQRDNEIVLNISVAGLMAVILGTCVGAGLSVIWLAFTTLIHEFKDFDEYLVYAWIWCFAFFVIGIGCFVSYVSRRHEDIRIPASCKVIFLYVLFPLYLLLLVVLYAYVVKCLATLSLPMREMNLFISFATALYLVFYLTLSYYKTPAVRLFFRFGAFVLVPLIAIQCYISVDRIAAHGVSVARYASMLYIAFSIVVVILSFVRRGRHMLLCCPVLAAIALFACLSPWNLLDVPYRSQMGIMLRTLEKYGLFVDGRVLAERSAATLPDEDKNTIVRAYDKLSVIDRTPDWYVYVPQYADNPDGEKRIGFAETFGFEKRRYGKEEERKRSWEIVVDVPTGLAIDVSGYTELYAIARDGFVLQYGDCTFDIQPELLTLWTQAAAEGGTKSIAEPLVFADSRGYTVYVTAMEIRLYATEDEFWERVRKGDCASAVYIEGFACR